MKAIDEGSCRGLGKNAGDSTDESNSYALLVPSSGREIDCEKGTHSGLHVGEQKV